METTITLDEFELNKLHDLVFLHLDDMKYSEFFGSSEPKHKKYKEYEEKTEALLDKINLALKFYE